jgi:glycosyltransferase involved in cell wall biosynthesis
MGQERLRIAMFSTIVSGGAGNAALRVHDSLRRSGAHSTLYVGRRELTKHAGVKRLQHAREGWQPAQAPGFTIFSVDSPGIPDAELDQIIREADVFNLHWCARFVSLQNIERMSRSGKPVILTIRDMNLFTGGCHFFHGCENWTRDCLPCPQLSDDHIYIPNATLDAKRMLWDLTNVAVVVLSDHTRKLTQQSPLLKSCRVEKIPNPIDVSVFKPHDRRRSRAAFGVPPGKRAIAYLPSFNSSVKGAAHAAEALRKLTREFEAKNCVVMTAGELEARLDIPFETVNAGFIPNKERLAQFYASADVTLIPSVEETFCNTAAESVACGTPIVGFEVGAIPEIAQDKRGRAVPVGDTEALAHALSDILSREAAEPSELHGYVADTFGAQAIAQRYLELFADLCACAEMPAPDDLRRVGNSRRDAAVDRLQRLLREFRKTRSIEIFTSAAKQFFSDNHAFWRRFRRLLAKG